VCASLWTAGARADAVVVRMHPATRAVRPETLAGLRVIAGLGDGLPRPAAGPPSPFDCDPARTFLVASDDATADAARLAARDDVAWAEPLRERTAAALPAGAPDDPLLRDTRQWGLWNAGPSGTYGGTPGADVNAIAAWRRGTGAESVRLAIADTGVDPGHPDLAAMLASGPRLTDGIDLASSDPSTWADSTGHGTAVAGVMAAFTNDGPHFDSLGVAGVCGGDGHGNPGCRLVPIRIARVSTATSWTIARAILHATAAGARALNLSFAGGGPSTLEREALHHAITRGCVIVAAAGNGGDARPMYPAAYAADGLCIAVGASDPHDRRAGFSSYGPWIDLVAPGVDVWTTFPTYPTANGTRLPGYVAASGTSFAAPFVTGAVGLLAAARPRLADTDFQQLLRATAVDVGAPGVDEETGHGRLDLAAALAAVGPGMVLWHDEVPATTIAFGDTGTLVVVEPGFGAMRAGTWRRARIVEVRASVTLPDSFADGARAWPRIAGTMAVRGGFRLPYVVPWCEVAGDGPRRFTLRGWLYRDESDGLAEPDRWLPLPPDQARFGFTVLGLRRARPRADAPSRPAASPNPFRGGVRLGGAGTLTVRDVAGRQVRKLDPGASVSAWWDGRDDAGRRLPAGLYFVHDTQGGCAKVLKLE